ncbi:MAG: peptidyl-prolyl cis-trans isomerase [Candidatus Desulfovibrio kirbyi]|uniref:Peptidyl-prolyl cis-trans isomerase n=1 Tax=Candidatus Desulfovibrio kirbyi TaxID=2696086 RepID=A0A6L2R6X5_9BACT|nr:SurA N-terminal domain-containing protein [Desulfovibrio sp.]GFH63300.1 MAG: peptidyl-prolyl cis-trans isomerase [Candidatus Desulfovibrio kirbyi]
MKKLCYVTAIFLLCLSADAQTAQINKIAAVANGQVITMFDLQKTALPDLVRAGISNSNNPAQADAINKILRKALDMMILDILIAQEAVRLKVAITPSDVDKELAQRMRAQGMTKEQFEAQLAKENVPVAELRANFQRSLLRQKVMSMEVGRRVVVTPEEIKHYYETNKNNLYDRNGLHMGLLVYAPNVDARALAAKIRDGSLSFAEATRKYSVAPNKDKGGDMGPVEWDRLNPEWEGRLTKMKPGEVTELFDMQGGRGLKAQVRLFRPGDGDTIKYLTLEEATPIIDGILRQPKAMERFEEYTAQLRKKAVIDVRL